MASACLGGKDGFFSSDEAISLNEAPYTKLPFAAALSALKAERGLTYRDIALATRKADRRRKGISFAHLSVLGRGQADPTPEMIALIADALELPETYFAEGRLAHARRRLDERIVGLDAALAELERIDQTTTPPKPRRVRRKP